jgi:hypothetical protein
VVNRTDLKVQVKSTLRAGGRFWTWKTKFVEPNGHGVDPSHYEGIRTFEVFDQHNRRIGGPLEIDINRDMTIRVVPAEGRPSTKFEVMKP